MRNAGKALCKLMLVIAGTVIPLPAYASFWVECKVVADISSAAKAGHYQLTIHRAVVTDGHVEEGSPCLPQHIGKTITVQVGGDAVPLGKNKTLFYNYYNDRTSNGMVNTESWTIPSLLQRIF